MSDGRVRERRRTRSFRTSKLDDRRWRLALLLLIGAFACFLRFWQLGTLPPGLYHDEAYNGLDAVALLQGETFPQFHEGWELYAQDAYEHRPPEPTQTPIFFAGNYGREPLHIYLMAASIALFGPTPFALRAVPALAGVLAVLTTYLAAGALWQPQEEQRQRYASHHLVPLLAAATQAILYPAITFSRFGIRAMLFVPLETLAVFFFWRGVNRFLSEGTGTRTRQRARLPWLEFGLAGFFLGAGIYTYAAARLLPLLFVIFIPLWMWLTPGVARRLLRPVVVMALVAILTAAPLLIYFARYPYFFFFRTAYVANKGMGTVPGKPLLTWLLNIGRTVRGLFWWGETHLRHNLPGRPYLDPIQAVLLLLGIVGSRLLARSRRLFLFLWLVVMLLPTILSGDAPHFGRMTGAAPVAAILVAQGIYLLMASFRQAFPAEREPTGRAIVVGLGVGLLVISGVWAAYDYFVRYAREPDLAADFYQDEWELGQFAASQPSDTSFYLTPTQAEMATIYFAAGEGRERWRSFTGAGTLVPAGMLQEPALYFVRDSARSERTLLQRYFPDSTFERFDARTEILAVAADAPRTPGLHPTDAALAPAIALVDWAIVDEEEGLAVSLYWQATDVVDGLLTAYVHLVDKEGVLRAQQDRPPAGYPTTEWRSGEIVADQFKLVLPPDLAPGVYTLRTGFYESITLEPSSDPVTLTELTLGR